ncbi:hypothetical protein [Macrococcus armenti]|uniref:hypothetical protein n=1 Tax=Macrococcus armenti TaxID=2875764 RepID=UPI001CCADDF5|nr:hypothetical protein [Macrococcus armenti]UBH15781.1 hypothetical protein LAU44_02200 [Macrococcus armenti]UBH18140.1 hypothetical protein LAU39_02205 [Macrococcus armenti]UBH20407.1 hypothetical protein LAU40_02200 [Macrococcus armenti]
MKVKHNTFPYPVLSAFTDDYNDSFFDLDVNVTNEYGTLWLNYAFHLFNDELTNLVKEQQAMFLIHLECSQTTYRNAITLEETKGKIELDASLIKGVLDVNGFLITAERIMNYTNKQFSDWYQSMKFTLNKGSTLSVAQMSEVVLSENKDDFKNIQSIINIRRSKKQSYMTIDYSSEKIIIALPVESYEIYAQYAKTDFKEVIITNVVFPALVHVFTKIEHQYEEFEDNRWYQVIKHILETSGDDITMMGDRGAESYVIVQKLLRDPVFKALNAIKLFSEGSED